MRMRKLASRRRKNKNTILIAMILVVIVFVCSTGYAFFSQKLDLQGTAKLNTDNPYCDLSMFNEYSDFEVSYDYTKYVDNELVSEDTDISTYSDESNTTVHVTAEITLKNIGTKTVNSWRLFIKLPKDSTMINFWNAIKVYEGNVSDGVIFVFEYPSDTFNNLMSPGETVSFNIMYKTISAESDIMSEGAYGWDLATETIPTIENMSSCIFNENSSTGGSSSGGGSGEVENPTYAVIPSTFENSYDGWREVEDAKLSLTSVTIGGTTSQVLSVKGDAEKGIKAILDPTNYTSGDYTYSVMISNADNESIPVELYYMINSGELIAVDTDGITIPGQWVELNGTITIPENATSVELYIIYPGINENTSLENPLYIDNINLEKKNSESGGENEPDPVVPSDGSIVASITNQYMYDYNDLKVYVTKLTLTNNTDTDISNWYVNVNIGEGGNALGCWAATCSEGSVVNITPAAWGNTINANSSITIEFQFATTGDAPVLVDYGLVS